MRKKVAKRLREKIKNQDPQLLLAIRNRYGDLTKEMGETALYRAAKKLYNQKRIGKE